jgi:ubiquinone/menaquinone biosynthesis C-methylase UbiE
MTQTSSATSHRSPGAILHAATAYDALVWLATLGRDRAFRETILSFAHLQEGEAVLDAGCGTGSLALAAKYQVGPKGTVHGVDASPEMIARARHKAQHAGLAVEFAEATAQALPFPEATFDVVLSTLMLHHLPHAARQEFAQETRRVLKLGGRSLIMDFVADGKEKKGFFRTCTATAMWSWPRLTGCWTVPACRRRQTARWDFVVRWA